MSKKFVKGLSSAYNNLDATTKQNYNDSIVFLEDTHQIITGGKYYSSSNNLGICDTLADVETKTVIIDSVNELYNGLVILVKFNNGSSSDIIKLNVSNLGDVTISNPSHLSANVFYMFIYSNNEWSILNTSENINLDEPDEEPIDPEEPDGNTYLITGPQSLTDEEKWQVQVNLGIDDIEGDKGDSVTNVRIEGEILDEDGYTITPIMFSCGMGDENDYDLTTTPIEIKAKHGNPVNGVRIEGEILDEDGYTITPITFSVNDYDLNPTPIEIKAKHGNPVNGVRIEGDIIDEDGYTITPIIFSVNEQDIESEINISAKHGESVSGVRVSGEIKDENGYTITPIRFTVNEQDIESEINISAKHGESLTHSWDGTSLTITDINGVGASVDLKGQQGIQGIQGLNGAFSSTYEQDTETLILDSDLENAYYNTLMVDTTANNIYIEPNKYYRISQPVDELTVQLLDPTNVDILNIYTIEFTTSDNGCTLILPQDIKWLNGNAPNIEPSITYQISITNNLAIIQGFTYAQ